MKSGQFMSIHPAFGENQVAVITGAADGIGLAAAQAFTQLGMRVCIADIDSAKLEQASAMLPQALAIPVDVAVADQVNTLREQAYKAFGQVDVLMNNAGISRPTGAWTEPENWQSILGVNLWGAINGTQAFTQAMLDQHSPGLIINTGSKQGITMPPGNPAYNVSKAGVKALTEALQHELRNTNGCQVSAHLLVPGFTYTGMIRRFAAEQPAAAWTPAQVVNYMIEHISAGDFYIICPDNDVDRATDNKRMAWTMGDLIDNRPPLSRWHSDYASVFEDFMADDDAP
jgi:NAD(P)-dependent dehydrogenase (short-subunit alcohol dehydrogenase family)